MSDIEILEQAINLLNQFSGGSDLWAVGLVGGAKEQLESVLSDIKSSNDYGKN